MSSPSFNSKLVRLKAFRSRYVMGNSVLFQFQTGSIKSVSSVIFLSERDKVSIPNWFD